MKKITCILLLFIWAAYLSAKEINFNDWASCDLTHVDITNIPGKAKILFNESDNFNGSVLNSNWTFESGKKTGTNENIGNVNLNNGLVILSNNSAFSEWFSATDTAPKIFQQVDMKDDFEIIAETDLAPGHGKSYEFYGLFLRENSGNAICIGVASEDNRNLYLSTWRNINSIAQVETGIGFTPGKVFFKISKIGKTVSTFYKAANSTIWNSYKTYTDIEYDIASAGVYFKSTCTDQGNITFDSFEYMTITAVDLKQAIIFTPPIDLGSIPETEGVLSWKQTIPDSLTSVEIEAQTGDSSNTTTGWSEPWLKYSLASGEVIKNAAKKYIRFKVHLKAQTEGLTPILESIVIKYPDIDTSRPVLENAIAYPTITKDKINISFTLNDICEDMKISILGTDGIQKNSENIGTKSGTVVLSKSVNNLTNGVYFVKITGKGKSGGKAEAVRKIIVKH